MFVLWFILFMKKFIVLSFIDGEMKYKSIKSLYVKQKPCQMNIYLKMRKIIRTGVTLIV